MSRSYNHRNRPRYRARRRSPNESGSYRCQSCKLMVSELAPGTLHRNHCPACLHSVHLDQTTPGDRRSECGGLMEPIAIWVQPRGEWSLVHRCRACAALNSNRIAGDDNPFVLMSLAARPVALPPFPIARMSGPSEPEFDEHDEE